MSFKYKVLTVSEIRADLDSNSMPTPVHLLETPLALETLSSSHNISLNNNVVRIWDVEMVVQVLATKLEGHITRIWDVAMGHPQSMLKVRTWYASYYAQNHMPFDTNDMMQDTFL